MAHTLIAKKRNTKETDKVRAGGELPAVVYGPQIGCVPITLDLMPFQKLLEEVGESTLIDFSVDGGEQHKVLIQDIQRDPVKSGIIHVDLRQIEMGKEIDAEVEIVFEGEAPAVKELSGVLVKSIDSVQTRCLPKDLLASITVDLSVLKTFEDSVQIKDLPIPAEVQVLDDPNETVATVIPQQEEKEEEVAPSVEDVEVAGKEGKKEDGEEVKGDDKKGENKKDDEKKGENKK
jgi:large subunit ribosomal protein L25